MKALLHKKLKSMKDKRQKKICQKLKAKYIKMVDSSDKKHATKNGSK
jgi:hypothetical protein